MNRAERRSLSKADLDIRQRKLENYETSLKQQAAQIDQFIITKSKEIASEVIQKEFMPITRDVLHAELKMNEEQISIFEENFKTYFNKRLEKIEQLFQDAKQK